MFLSIVIPTYNEEKRITQTLELIRNFLSSKDYDSEVIIVDDGSTDKTIIKIKNLRIISYQKNQGKGYAVKIGMLAAQGKYVLFTDADNSTPIGEVDKLLYYKNNYEIIIGSRYLRKDSVKRQQSFSRRILSRLGMYLVKLVIGLSIIDTQCGFKLFSQKSCKNIFGLATINRWGFDIEILAIARSLGYKIKEVPVSWYDDPRSQLRAGKAAIQTLIELLKIKVNLIKGKYKISSPKGKKNGSLL